jgi:hypothetical protein
MNDRSLSASRQPTWRPARQYDLEADPFETINIAEDRPDEVRRLKTHLARWRSGLEKTAPLFETLDDKTTEGLRAIGYLD